MNWSITDDLTHRILRAMRYAQKHPAVVKGLQGLDFDVVCMTNIKNEEQAAAAEPDFQYGFKIDWKNETAPSTVLFAIENFHNFMLTLWGKHDWLTEEEGEPKEIEWCVWYNGKYHGAFRGYKPITDILKQELAKTNLKKYYEYEVETSPFVLFLVPKAATDSL